MYCSKCGQQINDTDRFCPHCGAKVGADHAVAKVTKKQPSAPVPTQYAAVQPQYAVQPQPIIATVPTRQKKAPRPEKKVKKKEQALPDAIRAKVQFESRDLDVIQLAQGPTHKAVRFVEGAAMFVAILLISIFSMIFFATPTDVLTGEAGASVDVFTYAFFGDQSLVRVMMNIKDYEVPISYYFPYLLQILAAVATIVGSIATVFYGLAAFIRYMSGKHRPHRHCRLHRKCRRRAHARLLRQPHGRRIQPLFIRTRRRDAGRPLERAGAHRRRRRL